MNPFRYVAGAAFAAAGWLPEAPQHPASQRPVCRQADNRSAQVSYNDKLAGAAVMNRTRHQNEYNRATP
jgi:hypothetical protein